LFGTLEPEVATVPRFDRVALDETSWVDVGRDVLLGADALLDTLVAELPFAQGRRYMYEGWVDEPRLSCPLAFDDAPQVVVALADLFTVTYGAPFDSCFVNYYRDGTDSVAWHSDRIGRTIEHPLVAIVSLGGPRRFGMRRKGGGPAWRWVLGSGDALVMGGGCQHGFEHTVPKMKYAPPRISLSFRHH
jgi:alkylated DNA repair dioxygenase AlkB